jgi:WD40 repeat protein/Tfp pilus assembly protein PilF
MELVRGIPITEFCDRNQLAMRRRLELFIDVCLAVQHAHQKGIIHRDLKPSNVLVTLHDDKAVVKVIDFGIAKATGPQLTDKTLFTNFAQLIGTPMYMSPEQAQMSGLDVDTRSDIYSLGVLLYELLTGTTPFDQERLRTAGYDEMRRIIREEEPPKPSTQLSRLRNAECGIRNGKRTPQAEFRARNMHELDWIVMKALEKDRNRRYETANSFARDVQRYLADEPVQACPPSQWYRFRKFARRNKTGLLAASCVMLAAVLAAAAILWREKAAAEQAVAMAQENEKAETLARKKVENSLYFESIARAHFEWWNCDVGRADQILEQCAAEHRNWEWDYLKRLCHAALFTFRGHTDLVCDVAFSPDGLRLASAGRDGTIRVWDVETGREMQTLRGHKEQVGSVCFSSDGRWLASAGGTWASGRSGELKVWDLLSGRPLLECSPHNDLVSSVAFAPGGRVLASAGFDKTVKLWDVATGDELHTLRGHTGAVRCVAFSPDGQWLASGGGDKKIKVWDAMDGSERLTLEALGDVASLAFSPDSKRLVSGDYSGVAKVWRDLDVGGRYIDIRGHVGVISGTAFSPDGQSVATAGADGSARVWVTKTGKEVHVIRGHTGAVLGVAFSAGGGCLATCGWDQTVKVFDVQTSPAERTLRLRKSAKTFAGSSAALAFSPDGQRLVTATRANNATFKTLCYLQVWDAATSELVVRVSRPRGFMSVAFSPDGKLLAADWGADVKILDAATGGESATLTGHAQQVHAVAFNPVQPQLASAGDDETIKIWDLASARAIQTLSGHTRAVSAIAFHPDGKLLASASQDGTWVLWEPATGRAVFTGRAETGALNGVAFAPVGEQFATAGEDGTVRIWATATGELVRRLPAHVAPVFGVCYSADGLRLASCAGDGKVRIWDVPTAQEALTLKGESGELHRVAFCPKGRYLAASHVELDSVRIWDRGSGPLDPSARNVAGWHALEAAGFSARQQWAAAIAHLDRLVAAEPARADAWFNRAWAHRQSGNLAQAARDDAKGLESAPKNHTAHSNLAWFLATAADPKLRDPAAAVSHAETAVRLQPDTAKYWSTLGVALWRAGDVKAALEKLEKANELLDDGDYRHRFFLAMAYWQAGATDKAREAYAQGARWMDQKQPDNEELRRFRSEAEELMRESGVRNQESGVRNQESGVRDQ